MVDKIKDFKGKVHVADVQTAFDTIEERINNIIDQFNAIDQISELDYTNGKPVLGPADYTLTVGGLKKLLEVYNGCHFGCKCIQVGNKIYMTQGMLLTTDGGIQIPATVLDNVNYGNVVYNKTSGEVSIKAKNAALASDDILITSLCTNRKGALKNDIRNLQLEKIPGYKVWPADAWCDGWTDQNANDCAFIGNSVPQIINRRGSVEENVVDGQRFTYGVQAEIYRAHNAMGTAKYMFKPRGMTLPQTIRRVVMSQQVRKIYIDRNNGSSEEL